jgi:hypothetical protein
MKRPKARSLGADTSGRLATDQETLQHDLFRRVKEKRKLRGNNGALEGVGLVELAREAFVESMAERTRIHGVKRAVDEEQVIVLQLATSSCRSQDRVSIFSRKSFFCCCSLSWVSELIGKAAATGAASRDAALVAVLDKGSTL